MKTTKTKNGQQSKPKQFKHEELLEALMKVDDISERLSNCPFIPLHNTAKEIGSSPDAKLSGDGIYIGILEKEWTRQRQSTFRSVSDAMRFEVNQTDKGFTFKLKEIPIDVTIIKRKYKFFNNLNIRFYNVTEFLLPNPLDGYLKAQHLVR